MSNRFFILFYFGRKGYYTPQPGEVRGIFDWMNVCQVLERCYISAQKKQIEQSTQCLVLQSWIHEEFATSPSYLHRARHRRFGPWRCVCSSPTGELGARTEAPHWTQSLLRGPFVRSFPTLRASLFWSDRRGGCWNQHTKWAKRLPELL